MRKKILIGLVLLFIFIVFTVAILDYYMKKSVNQSIIININQIEEGRFQVEEANLVNMYPPDYRTNINNNYLQFTLYDGNGKEIFKGRERTRDFLFFDLPDGGGTISKLRKHIELVVPYYPQARSIKIQDEFKNEKLNLDLTQYKLKPKGEIGNTRCGNTICDVNEHIWTCFNDCNPWQN